MFQMLEFYTHAHTHTHTELFFLANAMFYTLEFSR